MDPTIVVNERVDVVSIFSAKTTERLACLPWKMKWRRQEIELSIFGMRHPTTKGKRMIHVFEMSDGINDYRLEFDAEHLYWILVSMIEGHSVRSS